MVRSLNCVNRSVISVLISPTTDTQSVRQFRVFCMSNLYIFELIPFLLVVGVVVVVVPFSLVQFWSDSFFRVVFVRSVSCRVAEIFKRKSMNTETLSFSISVAPIISERRFKRFQRCFLMTSAES